VVPNQDGTIAHAQLSFGNGMIMLGSVLKNETAFGRLMKQSDEIGGAETQLYTSSTMRTQSMPGPRLPERRSLSRSRTKTRVVATAAVTTWKGISGASAPMIHGWQAHEKGELLLAGLWASQ
jgi:hypothetical protein